MDFYQQSYVQDLISLISAFWLVHKLIAKISICMIRHYK